MQKTVQVKPQEMQKTIQVKPSQAVETNMVVKSPPAPETTMVVKNPPGLETTTTEAKFPLGTETKVEVKPPKRSWARILMKLFKRKKPDPAIAFPQSPGEKKEGPLEATTISGDSQTQEGEVRVEVKLQVSPRGGPAVPSLELDEHKINGLRSGGGKFMPCLPTILTDKSSVQNAASSNVHTLFFSADHDISVKAEVKDNARKLRKGCLPSSPRDGPQVAHNTSKRGQTSKLPWNRRKRAANHAHGRNPEQGCFPQLSRRSAPLEDPEASRFTYLQVGEDGNYGSLSEDGSVVSNELTYLEFKEGGRYEPKDEVLKLGEMTYLDLDKEGKYESSMQQKSSDALDERPRNMIDAELKEGNARRRTGVNRGQRVHPRTSIISLESDDESSDIFESPEQLYNDRSLPTTDPSSILLRQSISQDAFHHNMGPEQLYDDRSLPTTDPSSILLRQSISQDAFHHNRESFLNSPEANDVSNDHGEQKGASAVTKKEIKVEKGGLTTVAKKGWLPIPKYGPKSYFFPPKEGTLKEDLPSIDSVDKKVDISTYVEWNDPPNLQHGEIGQTDEKDDDTLKSRCLRLKPLRRKVYKSSKDHALISPLLKSPPDLLQEEVSNTPEKKKDGDLRNRCLGLQPLKYYQKKPLIATGLEDITPDGYNISDFDEPWKGEEVADFELRDFKRVKKRKSLPVSSNGKNDCQKSTVTPMRTVQNDNGDDEDEDDAGNDDETDWEHSKVSRGCLPFGRRSKTDYEKIISTENVSLPLESYNKDDIYIALDELQAGDYDMDCTGTVIISVDSDDEIHSMEISELDNCSKSNPVYETPWDETHKYKPQTGCLPFGRKLRNLPDLRMGSEDDLDFTIDLESSDPRSLEATKTDWNDLNENPPQRGCFPFGLNEKKDFVEAKLMSTELDSVQSNEPQMEDEADERQCEDFGSRNPKKWCFPFGRQRMDYIDLASTSMDAADTAPGTARETVDQNLNGEGEDFTQCPLLSDWHEQTSKSDWFPSNCFSKKPSKSPFTSAEHDPNQFRVDLELRNTEMHSCLPCVRKSRKEKLLYIQSGPNSSNSFEFELDIDTPLMEEGDETHGDEHHSRRSRNGCLPLSFKSEKKNVLENSTCMNNAEKSTTSTELQQRDSAAEKKSTCTEHIFTPKLKPTPTQNLSSPQNDAQANTLFTTPVAEEDSHGFLKTGCARFPRHWNPKKGDPTSGAALESLTLPSPEKVEETESAKVSCSLWSKKSKCNTGVGEVLSEMSGCNTLDMEDRGIHMEDSMDDSGETSCGRFCIPKIPRRTTEESVTQSEKPSCGMFWMKQGPENPEQSKNQSGSCDKFWMKQDPQKQIGQSAEASGLSSCSRLLMKKDATSQVEVEEGESGKAISNQEHLLKLVEDALDESEWPSSNQEHVLKALEDTLAKSNSSCCGKLPGTEDVFKQLQDALKRSRRASCDGFSVRKHSKNEREVLVNESGKARSNQENILKELEDTLDKTRSSNCGKLPVTQEILKQFQQTIERSRRASCTGSSRKKISKNELEVLVDESGRASSSQENILKDLEDTLAQTKSSNCGKLPVTQDILKQFQQAIERSRRASCDGFSTRKHPKTELQGLVDKYGTAGSNQEPILKDLEDTLAQTKSSNCGKLPVTQDILKQFQEAIQRSRRTSCDGFSMRKHPKTELQGLVDEYGTAGSNQETIWKEIEHKLTQMRSSNCGKLPVPQDIFKQFQQTIERSRKASCSGLSARKNLENELEVLVDESGRANSDQEYLLKELEDKQTESKSSYCDMFPTTQDTLTQFQRAIKRSKRVSCDGLSTSEISKSEFDVLVDESESTTCGKLLKEVTKQSDEALKKLGRNSCTSLSTSQNATNQRDVLVDEYGKTTCGTLLKKQDTRKQLDETAGKPGRTTCNAFSTGQNELCQVKVVVDKSGRPTCGDLLMKHDPRKQCDDALTSCTRAREKVAEVEKSGKANCGRYLMNRDAGTMPTEEAIKEPLEASCDNISIKRNETSQFETEGNKSGDSEKFTCLPLKQGERNRLGEAIDELRKITCGGVSMRSAPQKQTEVIAQKNEKNLSYDDVFSLKPDSQEIPSSTEIGKGVGNGQRNLVEYTQEKILTLLGGVCNQRAEVTHLNQSEVTALISHGGHSRKGFLKRYCACMAVSDHSSISSKCNEAPVKEESEKRYPDLSSDAFKSKVGFDCMPCCAQTKIDAIADTSRTIDCTIKSHIYSFPMSANVTSLDKDPRFEAQREIGTPESKNGSESARDCVYGRMPDGFQGGCGISQLNPFGKCASRIRQDDDVELSFAVESDPLSQRHIEDDQQKSAKNPSQRSNRERWMPYLGKDSESGVLKPFHSRDDTEPPVPTMESSDEQDEYQKSLGREPEPVILTSLSSREGPEDPLPKKEFKTNKQDSRLYPEVEVRHSCQTFRPYKGADICPSEVSSTARKEIEETWKDCKKLDSASVPQSGDICLEDSWLETECEERPENKWLRREAREPLAEKKGVSIEKRRKDWVQDDDITSTTQESTPSNENPHDKWSKYWQKEPLQDYFEQTGKEEKTFVPQNSADSQDSAFEDGWGKNQNTAAASEVPESIIPPPMPLQHQPSELESQGLMVPRLDDEPEVAAVYTDAYGYQSTEVSPSLPHQRNPEDDQLLVDQTSSDSNHNCLGRNWQSRPKQESVAEALEASETLLRKLTPVRLPKFESGQVESSSSGLSQNTRTCCPISLFQTKEKRKPKRTHTKEIETPTTCCRGLPNRQTDKEIVNPDIDERLVGSVSTRTSQETFQEENRKRKKQKTTSQRRVRGSSTPVGQFEGRQIHPSRKLRDGEHGVHAESKELNLSAPRTFQKKNEPLNAIITESEENLDFKDQSSPNRGQKLEQQKSKAFVPTANASNNFCIVPCDKPPEPSVDRARQERVLGSRNCFTANGRNKASCSQQPKLDQSKKTKKISQRPACATNICAAKRWTSDEDSESEKHQGHLVSGEKKTSGRHISNTYRSRSKKHPQIALTTSTTDSSSSGEDIYDIASKRFRDNLFKNKHRDNCEVTESTASQPYSITKDGVKNYQGRTTENQPFISGSRGGAVGPILQKFEESDEFCRSPVFKELVAVESQMKDISKIIKGIAGPDYLDAVMDTENQVQDDNVSFEDEPRCPQGNVSVYQNPIWFSQWKEPISVQMATRLAGDEVPVYYDEGFQIGYIPIGYRGSKGMRKTKKAEELTEEYSKFTNQKIKVPSDEDTNVYYENSKNGTHPKKRFSQKFTAKRLLHEKLHPHDHRISAVVQVEEAPEYSSSSSDWSGKEDLIQSHRKVFCKDLEVMSIRKKSPLNGDSSDESFPSPRYEVPSVFMGQVDEELARLKIAKRQLQEGFQEPIGTTLPYKMENCNRSKTGPTRGACDEEDEDCQSDDSDFIPVRRFKGKSVKDSTDDGGEGKSCFGWANKSVQNSTEFAEDEDARDDSRCVGWMGGCMSPGKSRAGSPSKTKRALENKEFQLLQRRVRKELGGKRQVQSAKIAQHSPQEGMVEQLKEVGALRSEQATNLGEYRPQGAHYVDVKLGPSFAESNQEFRRGKSSLVEEVDDVPVSSLVKLMFGTHKTTNLAERTQESANKLHAAEVLIQKKVGDLEAEIANFQESNRRLGVITKENAAHMSRLMQERLAWEAQKNADMEALQQYKEAQMNKLQKEKCKLEQQTRAQIPKKEERKEIEELRAKLAEERELHLKKELQWRQTSNRLRRVNDDLKKQIHELRKEIGWHEDRLLMETAAKGSYRDCTFNSRQKTWNANRSTCNENAVGQPRQKARQERNVNTSTNAMREALDPAKFKVEIIKKKEQPTRIKLDVGHKNLNRNKEYLRDNSITAVALDTLSICEDAATALASKMKLLEREIEQWMDAHSSHCNQTPLIKSKVHR